MVLSSMYRVSFPTHKCTHKKCESEPWYILDNKAMLGFSKAAAAFCLLWVLDSRVTSRAELHSGSQALAGRPRLN